MPDPALLSAAKCLISGMADTNEKYCSISENQIIRPPGHAPCVEVYFRDRKKLNFSFCGLFCVYGEGCQFFLALPQGKERKSVWQNEKSESGLENWKHGWRLRKRNTRSITAHGGSRKSGSRGTGKQWGNKGIKRNRMVNLPGAAGAYKAVGSECADGCGG